MNGFGCGPSCTCPSCQAKAFGDAPSTPVMLTSHDIGKLIVVGVITTLVGRLTSEFIFEPMIRKWRAKHAKANPQPASEASIYQDAVRVVEYKYKKPYKKFEEKEHTMLDRLFRKASDNRISLKIYPDKNPSALVKTKADEAKWRRAIRSAKRKFKIRRKEDFTERQWRYVVGAFKRMRHI